MRVIFPMRFDAISKPGGDTVQIKRYILELSSHGIFGEICVDPKLPLDSFDIAHLSNIDRPIELFVQWEQIRAAGLPYIISPIHHSYSEIENYERNGRKSRFSWFLKFLNFYRLEKLRSVLRGAFGDRRWLMPQLKWIFKPTKKCQGVVLNNAGAILYLNRRERALTLSEIGYSNDSEYFVPNGVEVGGPVSPAGRRILRDFLCVGRIEARKNQVLILEAAERLGVSVTFVGAINPNHLDYAKKFKAGIESSKSIYLEAVTRAEVLELMSTSRCHISASWFEVSSLVDFEAYLSGCIVISSVCGGSAEALSNSALYCAPNSVDSIMAAMGKAPFFKPVHDNTYAGFKTWPEVSSDIALIYNEVCIKHV